jgi:hypothetical protein
MRRLITFFVFAMSASFSNVYAEDNKTYIELSGVYGKYQETNGWFTTGMGALKLGVNLTDNFSIEGLVATSLADTNFYVGTTLVSARIDNIYGGYLKVKAPASSSVDFFGRIGVAGGQVSASTTYGSSWLSDTGLSYGGGVDIKLEEKSYVSIDYTSYYNKSGISVRGFGIGYGFRF